MTESGRSRLATMFAAANADNRAVLLPYLTAGIPSIEDSVELFVAMSDAGADGFEVGIPYADPLMDGPVIMEAGARALSSGVTVDVALDIASQVTSRTGKPVVMMTYVNPVLRIGIGAFFDKVVNAGACGVILADLPVDEAAPFLAEAADRGIGLALFAAPTTDDARLDAVVGADPALVYAIAEVGVTGERERASVNVEALASRIRERSDVPIVFGVGISTPDHAAKAAAVGDGVIVGTAIVRRVLEANTPQQAQDELSKAVKALATAVKRP